MSANVRGWKTYCVAVLLAASFCACAGEPPKPVSKPERAKPERAKPEPAQTALLPRPARYLTDLPRILASGEAEALEERLAAFDRTGRAQLIVYICPEMGGHRMEDFTIRTPLGWVAGKAERDWVVIFIFIKEGQIGLGASRGLEKSISEAFARLVIEQDLAPAFGVQQFGRGLSAAVDRIIRRLGESGP